MIVSRWKKSVAVLCALALSLSFLGGCRYTDVMYEEQLDQLNGETDYTLPTVYSDVDDSDPTDSTSTHEDETDRETDQADELPTPDTQQQTQDSSAVSEDSSDDAGESGTSVQEDDVDANFLSGTGISSLGSGNSGSGGGSSDSSTEDPVSEIVQDSASEDPSDDEDSDNEQDSDDDSLGGGVNLGGSESSEAKEIYDDSGYNTALPHVGTIAAVGQYALIVQMIGGEGALAGADSSWLSYIQSTPAFPDGGLENVSVCWSGDGSQSSQANLDAIVASGAQAVLLERDSSSLSDDQINTLLLQGIEVILMPHLGETTTKDSDITMAVRVVGEILKLDTNGVSEERANAYVSMHDNAIAACVEANGGYSYKIINGNTYNIQFQGDGPTAAIGWATVAPKYATAFVDVWSSVSPSTQVINASWGFFTGYQHGQSIDFSLGVGLSVAGSSDSFILMDYYLQASGVMDTSSYLSTVGTNNTRFAIVSGSFRDFSEVTFDYNLATWQTGAQFPLRFKIGSGILVDDWVTLGDTSGQIQMPAIITRNEEYADYIVASASVTYGAYDMGQVYEVYVMPSGIAGSWADGTVESYLLAPWAYCMYQQGKDLSTCSEYIDQFYQYFYGCSFDEAYQAGVLSGYGVVKQAGSS